MNAYKYDNLAAVKDEYVPNLEVVFGNSKSKKTFPIYTFFKRSLIVIVVVSLFAMVYLQARSYMMSVENSKVLEEANISLQNQDRLQSQIDKKLHYAILERQSSGESAMTDGVIIITGNNTNK